MESTIGRGEILFCLDHLVYRATMKHFTLWLITRFYWASITLLYKTARIRFLGEEKTKKLISQGQKVLFCFFHGDYLFLFPQLGGQGVCIFTTQSSRGAVLAEIIRLFNYHPCLIPDKRGSRLALERMVQEIRKDFHAVVVVDGPLGPYHKVKHGIVVLAKETGNPIVPVGIASSWKIVMKKRWDRYTIPLPFTRSVISYGEPIFVPRHIDQPRIEQFRLKVESDLNKLNRDAEASLKQAVRR